MKIWLKETWQSKYRISVIMLVMQVIMIFELLVINELSLSLGESGLKAISLAIEYVGVAVLITFNCRYMYFFWKGNKFAWFMALTIVSGALQTIAFYSPVPYPPQSNWYKLFIMVAIALPYLRLLITSVYIMKDSLRERENKLYSLVGASNLYMIFPFLFLIIMTSIELVQPMVKELAFNSIIECFTFYSKLSFYGAVGYDMPQYSMSPVLSNILTFEHYFMNLFIICAVGRLVEK